MKKVSAQWLNSNRKMIHSNHVFQDSTENIEDEVRKEIEDSLIKLNESTDFRLIKIKIN
jgi:hypothetical protein